MAIFFLIAMLDQFIKWLTFLLFQMEKKFAKVLTPVFTQLGATEKQE